MLGVDDADDVLSARRGAGRGRRPRASPVSEFRGAVLGARRGGRSAAGPLAVVFRIDASSMPHRRWGDVLFAESATIASVFTEQRLVVLALDPWLKRGNRGPEQHSALDALRVQGRSNTSPPSKHQPRRIADKPRPPHTDCSSRLGAAASSLDKPYRVAHRRALLAARAKPHDERGRTLHEKMPLSDADAARALDAWLKEHVGSADRRGSARARSRSSGRLDGLRVRRPRRGAGAVDVAQRWTRKRRPPSSGPGAGLEGDAAPASVTPEPPRAAPTRVAAPPPLPLSPASSASRDDGRFRVRRRRLGGRRARAPPRDQRTRGSETAARARGPPVGADAARVRHGTRRRRQGACPHRRPSDLPGSPLTRRWTYQDPLAAGSGPLPQARARRRRRQARPPRRPRRRATHRKRLRDDRRRGTSPAPRHGPAAAPREPRPVPAAGAAGGQRRHGRPPPRPATTRTPILRSCTTTRSAAGAGARRAVGGGRQGRGEVLREKRAAQQVQPRLLPRDGRGGPRRWHGRRRLRHLRRGDGGAIASAPRAEAAARARGAAAAAAPPKKKTKKAPAKTAHLPGDERSRLMAQCLKRGILCQGSATSMEYMRAEASRRTPVRSQPMICGWAARVIAAGATAWYGAKILSVEGDSYRVHFLGWGAPRRHLSRAGRGGRRAVVLSVAPSRRRVAPRPAFAAGVRRQRRRFYVEREKAPRLPRALGASTWTWACASPSGMRAPMTTA